MCSASDETMKQSSASASEQSGAQKCCAGCGSVITERFYAKVYPNFDWHSECLRCVECNQQLNLTCFMKGGKLYCKADYLRVFSVRCAKCGDVLKDDEYVMRAKDKFYHMQCFSCTSCSKRLNMGDFCAVLKDGLYCRVDYDAIDRSTLENRLCPELKRHSSESFSQSASTSEQQQKPLTVITNSPDSSAIIGSPPSTVSSLDTNIKSENANGASGASKNQDGNNNTNGAHNENSQRSSGSGSHSKSPKSKAVKEGKEKKTTRVRTVLNEKQLHTLRACYAANPRPDALMKDQLVEMTQLSPRVIRVWFQNKRCKDKKRMMMLKQMQQQQHEKQSVLQRQFQAMPLVAQQPAPMMYEQVGDLSLTAADIVAVQNSGANPKTGVPVGGPGTSIQMWSSSQLANANPFIHHDMIAHADNGSLRTRPLLPNDLHNDANAALSHMHLLAGYAAHDDDTIVSMDGDRSCYSR